MKGRRQRIILLNVLTLFNHAVVSWLILALPKIQHLIGKNLLHQGKYKLMVLGVLMSVKPIMEATVAYFYSLKSNFDVRRALLFCIAAIIASACCFAYAIYMHWFYLLFVAQFFLGIGCSAIFLVQLLLAENSSHSDRTRVFNFMEWSIGIGMSLGPIVGVWVVHFSNDISFLRPFLLIGIVASIIWSMVCMQSNLQVQENKKRLKLNSSGFYLYLSAWICFMFAWQGYFHWFPSLMYDHFKFTHANLGLFYTVLGLFYIVCQILIVNLCTRFNIHRRVILITLPVLSLSFFIMAVIKSLTIMYVVSAVYMLAISFFLPFWKAYLSLLGLRSHQQLFSIITIATSLCAVASTFVGGFFADISLTISFTIFSAVMLLALLLFIKAEQANV